ncbi:MAG: hypothetical protein PHF63_07755 [Herbinix sp.]|nr:hypothetical protein [Herbinix sp.]
MIDLHTHLLPNIDDGACSIEEALKMIEALHNQKVNKIVCTPHFDPTTTSLQDFSDKRAAAISLLSNSKVVLVSGSETTLHDYLFNYPDLSPLYIGNSRYLLLELPFGKEWDNEVFKTLESLLRYYDLFAIIAHIERYPAIKKNENNIKKLIEMGCLLQLNTNSIIDKKLRPRALKYIKRGYIDVLASDCHNMDKRPPIINEAFNIVMQKLGTEYSDRLKYNAECIVNGSDLRQKTIYIIE